jgi:hypothetical protein
LNEPFKAATLGGDGCNAATVKRLNFLPRCSMKRDEVYQ